MGKSYEGDVVGALVIAYAVALDDADGRVWMLAPDDLAPDIGS